MTKCLLCENTAKARQLCMTHYQQAKRNGQLDRYKKQPVKENPFSSQINNVTFNTMNELVQKRRIELARTINKIPTVQTILESVAGYAGVSVEMVRAIKDKHSTPSLRVAVKIARFFDKTVEEVFEIE